MKNINHLLKPGERVDASQYPWPKPQPGDLIRAYCLFDLDPQAPEGEHTVVSLLTDCRVRYIDPSVNEGLWYFLYEDITGAPLPGPERRFSEYAYQGIDRWSSMSYWGEELWYSDWMPLSAIKPALLSGYAEKLARRAKMQRMGVYA